MLFCRVKQKWLSTVSSWKLGIPTLFIVQNCWSSKPVKMWFILVQIAFAYLPVLSGFWSVFTDRLPKVKWDSVNFAESRIWNKLGAFFTIHPDNSSHSYLKSFYQMLFHWCSGHSWITPCRPGNLFGSGCYLGMFVLIFGNVWDLQILILFLLTDHRRAEGVQPLIGIR